MELGSIVFVKQGMSPPNKVKSYNSTVIIYRGVLLFGAEILEPGVNLFSMFFISCVRG
jgi:hypothetical protein